MEVEADAVVDAGAVASRISCAMASHERPAAASAKIATSLALSARFQMLTWAMAPLYIGQSASEERRPITSEV